jgi:hypothetical protein
MEPELCFNRVFQWAPTPAPNIAIRAFEELEDLGIETSCEKKGKIGIRAPFEAIVLSRVRVACNPKMGPNTQVG